MGEAKNIIVKPISSRDANRIIKELHYSKKVANNSQLHFGVFFNGNSGGGGTHLSAPRLEIKRAK
jgi:hypothetical protein